MQISLIIPMYNERGIIADTALRLSQYMSEHFDSYEILFSDDGSTDGCGDAVRELALPCVYVTGYPKNQGKGCAIRTAMLEARGDFVLFTDADLAYGTDVIGQIYTFYQRENESKPVQMVTGSRTLHQDGYSGYSVIRKLMSKVYIRVLCVVGGFRLSDSQCGCKGFSRDAARNIFSRCQVNGFAFDFEAILWAECLGYRILEFPVQVVNHRDSKVHIFRDSIRMLLDLRRIRKSVRKQSL
ncbi:MAG: glycosyltransferase [Clostridia bacterium]|nr:glycosyltransferase [Clostridia bacterium]